MQNMYQNLELLKEEIESEEEEKLVVAIDQLLECANDLKRRFEETPELSEAEAKLKNRLVDILQNMQHLPSFTEALELHHRVKVLRTLKSLEKSLQHAVHVIGEEERKATRYAYWLLARRSMHSFKLARCLKEKGYSDGVREKILQEITQSGLLNDRDYVAHFIAKWQKAGKSYAQILQKAKLQEIPLSEIKQVKIDDSEVLLKLIHKRYPQLLEKKGDFRIKQKAIQALLRRGFSLEQITSLPFYTSKSIAQ